MDHQDATHLLRLVAAGKVIPGAKQVGGTTGNPLLLVSHSGLGAFRLGGGAGCCSSLTGECTAAAAAATTTAAAAEIAAGGCQEGADPSHNNNSSSSSGRGYINAEGLASSVSSTVTAAAAAQQEVQHHQQQQQHRSSSGYINTAGLIDPSSTCTAAIATQCTACQSSSVCTLAATLQPGGTVQIVSCPGGGGKVLLLRGGVVVRSTQHEHSMSSTQHEHSMSTGGGAAAAGGGGGDSDDVAQLGEELAATVGDTLHVRNAGRYVWDVEEGDIFVAGSNALFKTLREHKVAALANQAVLQVGRTGAAATHQHGSSSSMFCKQLSVVRQWISSRRRSAASSNVPVHVSSLSDVPDQTEIADCSGSGSGEPDLQAAAERAAELLAAAAAKRCASKWICSRTAAGAAAAKRPGCLLPWTRTKRDAPVDDIICAVGVVTKCTPQQSAAVTAAPVVTPAATATEAEASTIEQRGTASTLQAAAAAAAERTEIHDSLVLIRDAPNLAKLAASAAAVAADGPTAVAAGAADTQTVAQCVEQSVASAEAADLQLKRAKEVTAVLTNAEMDLLPGQWALPAGRYAINMQQQQQQQHGRYNKSSSSGSSSQHSYQSDKSLPKLKLRAALSTSGIVHTSYYSIKRYSTTGTGSTSGSTSSKTSRSSSTGYYFIAPALGDSPTHLQISRRQARSMSSRSGKNSSSGSSSITHQLQPRSTTAAAILAGSSVRTQAGGRTAATNEQLQAAAARKHAAMSNTKAAAAAGVGSHAIEPEQNDLIQSKVQPAVQDEEKPAGLDCDGRQLYVGSRVAVVTEKGVAAVGTVKLLPGQKLDKWLDDKVWPEHVGVGNIKISHEMEAVARQAMFWVKCEGHGIYGSHPAFTFWSKRKALTEQGGINISVPCSSLQLL